MVMIKKKLYVLVALFCIPFSAFLQTGTTTINIIPTPTQVVTGGNQMFSTGSIRYWVSEDSLLPLVQVLKQDVRLFSAINFNSVADKQTANLQVNKVNTLNPNEYVVDIKKDIIINAGSCQSAAWALTSVLQLMQVQKNRLRWPQARIHDQPASTYRGVLLDVARRWHEAATIRSLIDICRFYKIPYIQLHLTDDQLFTFPSMAFPALATPGKHYTREELFELVQYGQERGVTLIPEMDLPGHSTAMRRAMPELFGREDLRVIDINKPEVYAAVKTLIKEMAAVFYTSPYIHIGADECNFEIFDKLPETQNNLRKKGYAETHDLLLEYIIEMNKYVKSLGKTTLMWESFNGKGKTYLTIPDDILIFAWETLYQRPDSLLDNGYTIMNAAWKPLYITPGYRWSAKYIYEDWNLSKWQNWWDAAPSYHTIQLPSNPKIIGAQYCSWEMEDHMEIPELISRIPAFSEKTWNSEIKRDYKNFEENNVLLGKKLHRIMYGADISIAGLIPTVEHEIESLETNFTDEVQIKCSPVLKGSFVTYTTDGTMPEVNAARLKNALTIDSSTHLQIVIFNAANQRIGFYNNKFRKVPVDLKITGNYILPANVNVMNHPSIIIKDPVKVETLFNKNNKGMVRYKISEKDKPGGLEVYKEDAKIVIDKTCALEVFIEDENGKLAERSLLYIKRME
ncbi:MAG: family 20 glycosylhydrolase [Chitinophagaceae bacterium]|nr:family 20 glycosylhydrolase [Chitinophagaceae bacterium]